MFGEVLKLLREKNNISQEELSLRLGLSRPAITKYERNERQPSFDTIIKIADYFHVSIDYLLGRPTGMISEQVTQINSLLNALDIELSSYKTLPEAITIYKEYKTQIDELLLDLLSFRVSEKT